MPVSNESLKQEYKAYRAPKKKSKYGNKITVYGGVKYHSAKEAGYAKDLDWKIEAGIVERWERQVPYIISIGDLKITTYILDFKVFYKTGLVEHIDVKGQKSGNAYELFLIKKRLMRQIHGINIIER